MKKQQDYKNVSLLISSLVVLIIAILNILSEKYFYGVSMLLVFAIACHELYKRYKQSS